MKHSPYTTASINLLLLLLLKTVFTLFIFPFGVCAQHKVILPISQAVVGKNADGRLEIFAVCSKGIYKRWQLTPGGNWSDWASMESPNIVQLSVANYPNGALALFGLGGDGSLWQTWETQPNGTAGWSKPWTAMHKVSRFKQILVGKYANGALAVFGIGLDNAVYGTWQIAPNDNWSPVTAMNGGGIKQLSLATYPDGALGLFGLGTDGKVYQTWQLSPSGNWTNAWTPMEAGGGGLNQIALNSYPGGALGLFGLATDGSLWQRWQTAASSNWTAGWSQMHNGWKFKKMITDKQANGSLVVFGIGTNDVVYGTWQVAPNDNWSQVVSTNGGGIKQITSIAYPTGALGVFGVGTDGQVYQAWQFAPNGNWTKGWTSMGAPTIIITCGPNEHWNNTTQTCEPNSTTPAPPSKIKDYVANLTPSSPPVTEPCLIYSFTLGTVNGPYGNLIKITNPNNFSIVMVGANQTTLTLTPGQSVSGAELASLYGSSTPDLPVTVHVCGDQSRNSVAVTLTYNCTSCL